MNVVFLILLPENYLEPVNFYLGACSMVGQHLKKIMQNSYYSDTMLMKVKFLYYIRLTLKKTLTAAEDDQYVPRIFMRSSFPTYLVT